MVINYDPTLFRTYALSFDVDEICLTLQEGASGMDIEKGGL